LNREHVSQVSDTDNLDTAIDAARVFILLKNSYRDACDAFSSSITAKRQPKIPPIKIRQTLNPTFSLALRPVIEKGAGTRLEVRVDADEGAEDDGWESDDGFGPGRSFFLIDVEDL
jgi:hypothetical protein